MAVRNGQRVRPNLLPELSVRIVMIITFKITDDAVPFKRKIQPEEAWLYSYPHTKDIVPANTLHFSNLTILLCVVWAIYKYNSNISAAISALLGVSLSYFLALTITNCIKLSVGRPRPDFFERCYSSPPKHAYNLSLAMCDMPEDMVNQGYKSFPSGHSTMAFSCMTYLSLYIGRSLRVFRTSQHYSGLRLLAFLAPLVCAALVAVSRTADYHHHWQDVLAGSSIGAAVAYLCYRQDFPGLLEEKIQGKLPMSPLPIPYESSDVNVEHY